MKKSYFVLLLLTLTVWGAVDYPKTEIGNGLIQAKLYLPDARNGFYRSTRFDWAGTIYELQYKGHTFFAPWVRQHDPELRDVEYRAALNGFAAGTRSANIGPVEEFSLPLGYDQAAVGGTFIKVGVGALRKPEEPKYQWATPYELVDPGQWTARSGPDSVEFTQKLAGGGFAYTYRKTVRLTPGKPELVLEHSLQNTGQKPIDTLVYNHNFLTMDDQPTGPDFSIRLPFEIKDAVDNLGVVRIRGKEIGYSRELEKDERSMIQVSGFGATAADYDIRVENRRTGAGVRITADRPLARLVVWSVRPTRCPEPFIRVAADPGKEFTWRITYEFYAR